MRISKEAVQHYQDEFESLVEQRDQIEEELSEALEDNAEKDELIAALRAEIQRLMADRSVAV